MPLEEVRDFRLATIYYSSGYFSVRQAIELDSLRYAIERCDGCGNRDWLLSAWLAAAGTIINAPGHTAQFLKPSNDAAYSRIKRQWQRKVWPIFVEKLSAIQPCGSRAWRKRNRVVTGDALDLVNEDAFRSVGLVYADPPYTKDHYSRFYHVYETLYRYDFPESRGAGRYRSDRFRTDFSVATQTETAFRRLAAAVAQAHIPLIVSYPELGLLSRRGIELQELLGEYVTVVKVIDVPLSHSTLGGSKGPHVKEAIEKLYVCYP